MTSPTAPTGDGPTVPALPRFFSRVADAVGPVAGLGADELARAVGAVVVTVVVDADAPGDPVLEGQAELACNLLARLYPRLRVAAPAPLADRLVALVRSVHPGAAVTIGQPGDAPVADGPVLRLQPTVAAVDRQDPDDIRVSVSGWNVAVDRAPTDDGPPEPLAALAGACLGAAEVFRRVFADRLRGGGRTSSAPGELNVLTCGPGTAGLPRLPDGTDMTGTVLAGAGAVGQAFLLALRAAAPTGTLAVADHDTVDLPNLQRYVLTDDASPSAGKTAMAAAAFAGTDMAVDQIPDRWGADPQTGPRRDTVVVALDSAADRIGVAAGLHRSVYNAWTQPEDLGWSRHESFGSDDEPCPACAYWPDRPRPHEHELIAAALRQHPLRALLYLLNGTPIGAPLPPPQDGVLHLPQAPGLDPPPDLMRWFHVPLAADLATAGTLRPQDLPAWAPRPIAEVYRDGVCAGGLVSAGPSEADRDALVPLAHQSALAGVMLAVQVLAARHPALRAVRPSATEGRIDLLRPLPQVLARPRRPSPGCLCQDPDMRSAWNRAWTDAADD